MKTFHIDKPDDFLQKIVSATFPEYTGRKFKLSTSIPLCLESYWDGGSRSYFAFYCLSTGKTHSVQSNHPAFAPGRPSDLPVLPSGMLLVEHRISCGKDIGITVFANQSDLAPLLPPVTELTLDEKIVLKYTRSLKSTYAGQKNYRFYIANIETSIDSARWEAAKSSLISSKCLNKAGAITPKGRNAIG